MYGASKDGFHRRMAERQPMWLLLVWPYFYFCLHQKANRTSGVAKGCFHIVTSTSTVLILSPTGWSLSPTD
jgi:hypothetical protein